VLNTISDAIKELKKGKIIVVVDDEDRENEGDFLALADYVNSDIINFMIKYGRGLLCTPISKEIAEKLNLELMVKENTESLKTAFTVSVDHTSTSTGISAFERADTIKSLANKHTKASDFKKPGHIFPLIAAEGGVLERPGHTEAAVDLAKLCGSSQVGVICEIIKDDGSMARLPDLLNFGKYHDLKIISIKDLIIHLNEYKA
jgi:3,4-dihydroxy 2-butanone 4-phosphate synthase / GTP cyclohydrolase II